MTVHWAQAVACGGPVAGSRVLPPPPTRLVISREAKALLSAVHQGVRRIPGTHGVRRLPGLGCGAHGAATGMRGRSQEALPAPMMRI